MSEKRLPGMAIVLRPGDPPPQYCSRCLSAPKPCNAQKAWGPIPEGVREYFAGRGYRALAQCTGCMSVLVEGAE